MKHHYASNKTEPFRKLVPLRRWDGPVVSAEDIRTLDANTINHFHIPGAVLMERAAESCASRIIAQTPKDATITVLVGPGNNGGDGSAVARLLHRLGYQTTLVLAAERQRLQGEAAHNLKAAEQLGIPCVDSANTMATKTVVSQANVWVDALLGVGVEDAPRGRIADLLRILKSSRTTTHSIFAIDLPTGLTTSTGTTPGICLRADETITLAAPKPAHFLPRGIEVCGDTWVAPIGVLRGEVDTKMHADAHTRFIQQLHNRKPSSYKTSHGHVLVVAGSQHMPGAAVLSCKAAVQAGAGLVSLLAPQIVRQLVIGEEPAIIGVSLEEASDAATDKLLSPYTSLLIGPGLSTKNNTRALIQRLLTAWDDRPCIMDASALTFVSELDESNTLPPNTILTPHPGELATLLGENTATVLRDIPSATRICSERYGTITMCKAAGAWIHTSAGVRTVYGAEPILATAGSGDVLAGIIAAFASHSPLAEAASTAALLHIATGRALAEQRAVRSASANDLANHIPEGFAYMLGESA